VLPVGNLPAKISVPAVVQSERPATKFLFFFRVSVVKNPWQKFLESNRHALTSLLCTDD
jgi:hypothetical protein